MKSNLTQEALALLSNDSFQQTSIVVEAAAAQGATYNLEWKEYNEGWEAAKSKTLDGKTKIEAEPLKPGTTYCLRLTSSAASGPGPELIVDTEQVGCGPKANGGCTIL